MVGYLTDRKQKVKINSDESGWESIQYGVPQGSVLGPLLFTLVVHDISTCIKYGNYHMYADDTQIYYHFKLNKINETLSNAQKDLDSISKYSERNCLNINAGKSKYILIGSKNNLQEIKKLKIPELKVGDNNIARESEVKNLGLIMDEHFTFESNTTSIVKKSFSKLSGFYNLRKTLSIKTKTKLAETYVLSQLNYCDIVTQGMAATQKQRLQKVQNSCLRYIFGLCKYDHITPYIHRLDTLNIDRRVRGHALTMLHKTANNTAPVYLTEKLSYRHNIHMHNTRKRNTFNIRRLHTAKKEGAFFVKTVNEYNALYSNGTISREDSVNVFKSKIRKYLKQESLHN